MIIMLLFNRNLLKILEKNPGINKAWILKNINKFNLKEKDKFEWNALMHIIYYNKYQKLEFNKNDILLILDKFDLIQQNKEGWNVLMYIIYYNRYQNLGFTDDDIIKLFDKFDLTQRSDKNWSVYDFAINKDIYDNAPSLNTSKLYELISKLDIESTDSNNKNILIKELKNGLIFNNNNLTQKILNTNNKKIINCVYKHIHQMSWTHEEILFFIYKNKLKFNDNIFNIM